MGLFQFLYQRFNVLNTGYHLVARNALQLGSQMGLKVFQQRLEHSRWKTQAAAEDGGRSSDTCKSLSLAKFRQKSQAMTS